MLSDVVVVSPPNALDLDYQQNTTTEFLQLFLQNFKQTKRNITKPNLKPPTMPNPNPNPNHPETTTVWQRLTALDTQAPPRRLAVGHQLQEAPGAEVEKPQHLSWC